MKCSSLASVAILAALAFAPALTACTDPTIDDGTTTEEIGTRARFDLWKDGSAYVFQLVSAEGETLIDSQDYDSRTAALGGLASVLGNGTNSARYTIVVAADGRAHFELHATNGQVIGTGNAYATRAGAEHAMKASISALTTYPRRWTGGTGARFEIRADAGGTYFFALHAANGETVLRSERYETLAAALNGAFSVGDNGTNASRYSLVNAASGGVYFNVMAANGQIIATSEVYTSTDGALRARDAIIALLPTVSIL